MKTFLNCFALGLAGSIALSALDARAHFEVSTSFRISAEADFYAPLSARGSWIEVGTYGRCWRPSGVAITWRPYCSGSWIWTDCGWFWESDEPWAWACYHYGGWVYEPVNGWIWIPGTEWAPAWVSWRFGGGYIGWAPLPPPRVTVAVAAPTFVFVQSGRFSEPVRPSAVIVNDTTIINKTTVINNIKQETRTIAGAGSQKVYVNDGPGAEAVQKATGKPAKAVSIREVASRTSVPAEVKAKASAPDNKPKSAAAPAQQPVFQPANPVKQESPKKEKDNRPQKESPTFTPAPPPDATPGRNIAPGEKSPTPPPLPPPDKPGKDNIKPLPPQTPTPGAPTPTPAKPGKAKPKQPQKAQPPPKSPPPQKEPLPDKDKDKPKDEQKPSDEQVD